MLLESDKYRQHNDLFVISGALPSEPKNIPAHLERNTLMKDSQDGEFYD